MSINVAPNLGFCFHRYPQWGQNDEIVKERDKMKPALSVLGGGGSQHCRQPGRPPRLEADPSSAGLILVAEHQEFIRGCLMSWLRSSCAEFEVVSIAGSDTNLAANSLPAPVAAILSDDPSQPGTEWIGQMCNFVRHQFPGVPVLVIGGAHKLHVLATAASALDLQGCLSTATPTPIVAAAVRLIVAGGTYFPVVAGPFPASEPVTFDRTRADGLTHRERAVAELVGRGMQNKVIAYELNISLSTVKAHVHSIIRKLKARNRTELAVKVTAQWTVGPQTPLHNNTLAVAA
jgi:DNA-binding NarL/FixJ family response regulator